MSLKSFATKGFSLAMNGKCNNHSKKASNYANKASNLFKSCRTTKDTNEKIEFNLIDENLYKFKDTKYSKDDIIDLV